MATRTSHLGLTKPVYTEKADVQALNGNMDILDKEVAKRTRVSNLLVNSNFADVINWQGLSSYTGQIYGIDCWYGRSIAQTVAPRGADVTVTATGTSYVGIKQKVNNIAKYAGKTLTFACNVYATTVPQLSFTDASSVTIASVRGSAARQQTLVLNYTIPANATADTVIPTIVLETSASGDYMRLYWAALYEGSYTIDSLPTYIVPDKQLEMIRCGIPLQPVNLLDNSDFRNPINQRGKTLYDTAGYTIDRWMLNNTSGSVTVNADSITLTNISTSGQAWFGQRVPNAARYVGKTVTLVAVRTDGTVHVKSGVVSETAAIAYSNGTDLSMRIEAVTTDTLRFNLVAMTPGKSITFAYTALYEGNYTADTLPEYQPKGYAVELMECMRYFQQLDYNLLGNGYTASSAGWAVLQVDTKVKMRVLPTVYIDGDVYARVNGTDYGLTWGSISAGMPENTSYVELLFTNNDTLPVRHSAAFHANGAVWLSADL